MSIMKRDGHPKEQPPLRRTQARRLTASIPHIHSIARVPKGQFNLESGTVNSAALITRRLIAEFRCVDSWIGIVRYSCFERTLDRKGNSGDDIIRNNSMQPSRSCLKEIAKKKEGRRINPLQVSPEGFHRNCLYFSRYPMFVYGPSPKECHLHL